MIENCSKCNTKIPDERVHLGYRECVECSSVEPYSAHVVYPHKTGAIVQPVQEDTKRNIQRLDRRSSTGNRVAKGIFADNSWDRWLKSYYDNIYNNKPKKKILSKKISNFLSYGITNTLPRSCKRIHHQWLS